MCNRMHNDNRTETGSARDSATGRKQQHSGIQSKLQVDGSFEHPVVPAPGIMA